MKYGRVTHISHQTPQRLSKNTYVPEWVITVHQDDGLWASLTENDFKGKIPKVGDRVRIPETPDPNQSLTDR